MAETVYYVDTDVVGGAGDGSSWANAYSSLNAAEAARGGDITAGNAVAFSCRGATNADTTAVNIVGWTTDADSYVRVFTETANRHAGVYTTSKYRLEVGSAIVLQTNEEFVRIEGLQLKKTASSGNLQACLALLGCGATNDIRFSECICVQAGNASYTEPGIQIGDPQAIASVWNCICYGLGSNAALQNAAIWTSNFTTCGVYSCTAIGNTNGIAVGTGLTLVVKNCYAYGSAAAYNTSVGTITQTTCAASDTTGSAGLDNVPYNTTTFASATPGNADYLKLVTGSALIGSGTNTTGDSAPFNFTTDIAGVTRGASWDVGAFAFVATGAATATASDAITVTDAAAQTVGNRVSAFEYTGSDTLASSNW